MKKVIVGVLVLGLVLIVGGVFLVFSNIDAIVKQVIETAGSEAVGTQVTVDSVDLELTAGTASIYGFSVANPAGYSGADMISFDELSVALDLANISTDNIGVLSVIARNPRVYVEEQGRKTNLQVVNERLAASSSEPADNSASGSNIQLSINSILIEDIEAAIQSASLGQQLDVNLGDISLSNLRGTPEQIASQVTRPLIQQLATNAGRAILAAGQDVLKESGQQVLDQADEKREQMEDQLKEKVDEAIGEDVRKGLGNLLKRD